MTTKTSQPTHTQEPHYVCTGGCKLVLNNPGTCNSPGCVRARNPLTLCSCSDNKHGDLLNLNATRIAR